MDSTNRTVHTPVERSRPVGRATRDWKRLEVALGGPPWSGGRLLPGGPRSGVWEWVSLARNREDRRGLRVVTVPRQRGLSVLRGPSFARGGVGMDL